MTDAEKREGGGEPREGGGGWKLLKPFWCGYGCGAVGV